MTNTINFRDIQQVFVKLFKPALSSNRVGLSSIISVDIVFCAVQKVPKPFNYTWINLKVFPVDFIQ